MSDTNTHEHMFFFFSIHFSPSELLPCFTQRIHRPEDLTLAFALKGTVAAFHLQA